VMQEEPCIVVMVWFLREAAHDVPLGEIPHREGVAGVRSRVIEFPPGTSMDEVEASDHDDYARFPPASRQIHCPCNSAQCDDRSSHDPDSMSNGVASTARLSGFICPLA